MGSSVVVRAPGPSFVRRLISTAIRSAGASLDQFGPFASNDGWGIVTGQSPQSYERVGRNIRIKGFEENAVVSSCIRVTADLVGPVRLEIYRENANGETILDPSNPGQSILDRPRVAWSALRLRQQTAAHIQSFGNAFWHLEGPTGKDGVRTGLPTGIQPIHPERILYVYLDADTLEPIRYDWSDRIGRRHESPWTDIVHFKDLTLDLDAVFGFPRGAAALLDMVTDGEASEFVRQVMNNNGAPGLLIAMKGITTEPQAKAADERWHENTVARGKRGRTRFLPNVENVYEIGFNLRDLEFPDLRQISREDICAVYGVDPRMIGVASAKGSEGGLSGQQYLEARRRLYLQTGSPLMSLIESELDLSYCPEFGEVKVRFSPDAIAEITEDEEQTSTRITRHWQAGIVSREEARKTIKVPEKMNPADHITVPRGTSVFTVKDADETAAAAAERIKNPPPPPPGTDIPPGAGPAGAPPAQKSKHPRIVKRSTVLSDDQKRTLWQHFDTRASKEEAPYRRTAVALFTAEREKVRSICGKMQRNRRDDSQDPPASSDDIDALKRAIEAMYGERSDVFEAWLSRYTQLVRETMLSASADIHASVDKPHLDNPRLHDAYTARAQRLAEYVTETSADQIMSAIEAGHTAGMSFRDIADLVDSSVFEGLTPSRSERIARTESAGALNEGEYVAAQATGVLQSHAWLSQRDDDVRDSHVECDAEGFIAMGDAFSNGLQFPGDPDGDADEVINCRCAQLFSDEAAE